MRVTYHDATGPAVIDKNDIKGDKIFICRCGISSNKDGLCDGSHKLVKDEPNDGDVFKYVWENGKRVREVGPCGCCED